MIVRLALKIDVDTLRGTLKGVPRLMALLQKHGANASFLFSVGPDHTGRAIRRALRPGFMKKVQRTSVVAHYGIKTLLYGTLLPGPDIGRRGAKVMRATREAGFETAIHCWDHVKWQDGVTTANAAWTEAEMRKADARYREIFGEASPGVGAAGWQMNAHAVRMTQRLGYRWASDCRGSHPFVPVWHAELVHCPQLPTTLPTLDELIGTDDLTNDNVHQRLLRLTAAERKDHVFTLHAELEGLRLIDTLDRLLAGWREQGYQLVSLGQLRDTLDMETLPRHEMRVGEISGRSGTLMVQGGEFLSTRQTQTL
nr:4-deoxy-4-formamido-L-arabinose-phosphoundecaprenol deformylase ArnD [uncultured bacterium]QLG20294.1 4-deoxy-4-formamido-L-arabinose-phosphoundecaprenol deformylase ArnD [uncultured bacterium]QLG20410.1 4-deoxy-4-formamido-L-arabinose-phosphoundecaprenol deformylase ArnD [uncultured bacterium]